MSEKPVAWMRREETSVPGTLRTYHSITSHKILDSDIPLYSQSPAEVRALAIAEAARECEETYPEYRGNGVMEYLPCYSTPRECAAAIRALSSPPSVSEEWVWGIATTNGRFQRINSHDEFAIVRATLAALGVEVK